MNAEEELNEPEPQLNLFPGFVAISAGKDELNFAEFPIAALANRVNPDIKTITYEDEIKDSKTGKLVARKLQITGSDLYGLPTSFDDEVILSLINLSKMQGFSSPNVTFTIHQIIRVLGWKNDDYYYKRIRESINRWLGVSLYYDNAWREKNKQNWDSEAFHLIDNISWGKNGQYSQVTWNKRIFSSFENGNLKALDLDIYRNLSSPTARRIYRFLDKRFGLGQSKWSFDLHKFAYNKIGLSKGSYADVAQIKRQLISAIKQLEDVSFIMRAIPTERFSKISRGIWKVHFERYRNQTQTPLILDVDEESECESRLVQLGIGRTVAQKILAEFGDERINQRLEWFEYREQLRQIGGIKSIPGYLIKSIKDDDFARPDGFVSKAEKAAKKVSEAEKVAKKEQIRAKAAEIAKARQNDEELEIEAAILVFKGLSDEKQTEIEQAATSGFTMGGAAVRRILIAAEVDKRITSGEIDY
jgi:Replication initiator protein A